MYLTFDQSLSVHLAVDHPSAVEVCRYIFAGWWQVERPVTEPAVTLAVEICATLPERPVADPFFVDERMGPRDQYGNVWAYDRPDGVLLYFYEGAAVTITWTPDRLHAHAAVTAEMLHSDRFEDVLFTSLAPLLRRCGYYALHAFAAGHPTRDTAVVLVGPSGSGKTTTGLNLVLNGWRLLSNDVLLLTERHGRIHGVATPGVVSIRPKTFDLLPRLRRTADAATAQAQAMSLTWMEMSRSSTATAAPIDLVLYPRITHQTDSRLAPMPTAISFAHLLEESLDSWDRPWVTAHTQFMHQLARQSAAYELALGTRMTALPDVVAAVV